MAGLWNRASAAWDALRGAQYKTSSLDILRELYGGRSSYAGKSVSVTTAIQVSAAIACGRVIAQALATMPFKLLRQTGRNIAPALDHRLYDKLMTAPNPLQSAFEFREQLALHAAFCGNAYVWIPTVSRGIDALYLLEPSWVRVDYAWPELPTYSVTVPGGDKFTLTWNEIWHIKAPAWCTYFGLEFIRIARETLGLTIAMEESQAKFQAQGVQTSGFLSVDGKLTDEQYKKLKNWILHEHSSSANAGAPMIIDNAAKWVSQAMSNVDAQTLEMRRFQIEEVCRFMGVMPIMVAHYEKTATHASAEEMFLQHLVHTVQPWATRIENSADRWLLSQQERTSGLYWKYNEKALIRMAAKDQGEYFNRLAGGPIMTRNEARAYMDMNPLDGLDDMLTAVNTTTGNPLADNTEPIDNASQTQN